MATIHDVAAYVLKRTGPITAMKLQKLCYYSQAWHMVWDECELFPEDFEAWANGPVSRDLFRHHRRQFTLNKWTHENADATALSVAEAESTDAVLKHYGGLTAQQLSDISHNEDPWRVTRKGLDPLTRSRRIIPKGRMHTYYSGLGA